MECLRKISGSSIPGRDWNPALSGYEAGALTVPLRRLLTLRQWHEFGEIAAVSVYALNSCVQASTQEMPIFLTLKMEAA
jgi:hypothetical protein